MEPLYIKEIKITGPDKIPSAVTFHPGVNLLYGPSNTGKTTLFRCIRALFFLDADPPETFPPGYDLITLTLAAPSGRTLTAVRRIRASDEDKRKAIRVKGTFPGIRCGYYKREDYEKLLLRLLGVKNPPYLYSAPEGSTQELRLRNIFSLFFLSEDIISDGNSPILVPDRGSRKPPSETTLLATILFLLDGTQSAVQDKVEKSDKSQRKELLNYLFAAANRYRNGLRRLGAITAAGESADTLRDKILEAEAGLRAVAEKSEAAAKETRTLLEKKAALETEAVDLSFYLREKPALIKTYEADLQRLEFIENGKDILTGEARACPLCRAPLPADSDTDESYFRAVHAEKEKTLQKIRAVRATISEAEADLRAVLAKLRKVNKRLAAIGKLIKTDITPTAETLRARLKTYRSLIRIEETKESWERLLRKFEKDIREKEKNSGKTEKWDARAVWKAKSFDKFSEIFRDLVRAAAPGFPEASVSPETMDALIGNASKPGQGQGYRAVINTLLVFALLKYLETEGKHPFPFLLLDSPIMYLTENESGTLKTGLLRCLRDYCGDRQIILADNTLPEGLDPDRFHIIHFTGDTKKGRYGFLMDNPNEPPHDLLNQ